MHIDRSFLVNPEKEYSSTDQDEQKYEEDKKLILKEASSNPVNLIINSLLTPLYENYLYDKEVVQAAVKRDPFFLRYVPHFQDDYRIVSTAIQSDSFAYHWASIRLKNDIDIKKLVEESPTKVFAQICNPSSINSRIFFTNFRKTTPLLNSYNAKKYFTSVFLESHQQTYETERFSKSPFIRDSMVTLFGKGRCLLPYSIDNHNDILDELESMLSPYSSYLLFNKAKTKLKKFVVTGHGFKKHCIDQAKVIGLDHSLQLLQGKTCLEGGNVFLFISKGVKKAIIGEFSLYLSMIVLEKQGQFINIPDPSSDDKEPSVEAYRLAKNTMLFHQNKNVYSEKQQIEYRKSLFEPLRDEEKSLYKQEAHIWDVKLKITRELIASELELSVENLIFVPQTKFHIDLEINITPMGTVILNDEGMVIEALNQLEKKCDSHEYEIINLLRLYRQKAEKRIDNFNIIEDIRKRILEEHEVDYVCLAANFSAKASHSVLNHSNGIFVSEEINLSSSLAKDAFPRYTYVTNGITSDTEKKFQNIFIEQFHARFPNIEVHCIENMSYFLSETSGGVRCLTVEESLSCESYFY